MVSRLLDAAGPDGAKTIVLRRGEHGVLAAKAAAAPQRGEDYYQGGRDPNYGKREAWAIPAVKDTRVVDVTGCGNAFCGGFLASCGREVRGGREGWREGGREVQCSVEGGG